MNHRAQSLETLACSSLREQTGVAGLDWHVAASAELGPQSNPRYAPQLQGEADR
jgi:hypothetical protein